MQVRVLQASQARESYLVVLSCFILCVWYMVRENSVPFFNWRNGGIGRRKYADRLKKVIHR